ncbi:MAG: efflux RND transporter periplasmic adaptor subunit [Pontiella sp.]
MKKLSAASIVLTFVLTLGCAKKNEFQAPPPPSVTLQNPEQKDVTVFVNFPGRLVAHDNVDIRARVKGFLKTIDFTDGQRVKKGDLLFTIEPESYEASVKSSEARMAQAKAALKLADATLQRTQKAFKTKAVSEVDVLTAEANKQGADAAVMEAQAALDNAMLDLSYTKIYAPMEGRLSQRTLSIGNLVGDGQSTLLTTLVVESPMDVFFNVDERSLIPFLEKNRDNQTGDTMPPVKLELADGSMHSEEGLVNYKDPEVDPETGTLRIRAVFENKDLYLVPGLYGKILIPVEIENALLVPDLAVQQDMAGSYVLTVNESSIVESIYVNKGPLVGTLRVIEEDPTKDRHLTGNDRIIINGLQRARPGIPVTATEAKAVVEAPASN